jgi:formamidopyrimidine-DNA glycosylase
MPELPEVESTVRYLRERVLGETISGCEVFWPRSVVAKKSIDFKTALTGSEITEVFRRGKFIGVSISSKPSRFLFIHLRMSGSLDVISAKNEIAKHDRVVIYLKNGKSIRFNDTRKFGRIYLCEDQEDVVGKLGVEPLSEEFTPEYLFSITRERKTRIKSFLLDQAMIAGLGNIYVDESLWKAGIHPTLPTNRLSLAKCQELHQAIKATLSEAIELSGTDFGDGVVQDGMYSPVIYGRDEQPCKRCSSKIKKIRVQQRGTHFCPRCQRAPRGVGGVRGGS